MRGSSLEEEIQIELDNVEMYSRRAAEAGIRLRTLLRERKRERCPPPATTVSESNVSVYFCRVPARISEDDLLKHFGVHGDIANFFFHAERRWGKVQYKYPEQQQNCLSQREFYQTDLGIIIEPHKIKRTRYGE